MSTTPELISMMAFTRPGVLPSPETSVDNDSMAILLRLYNYVLPALYNVAGNLVGRLTQHGRYTILSKSSSVYRIKEFLLQSESSSPFALTLCFGGDTWRRFYFYQAGTTIHIKYKHPVMMPANRDLVLRMDGDHSLCYAFDISQ